TDTSSPARFLAVVLAASGVVAGAAAGAAGVVAGLVVWAKPGPAMAGTATAATSRYANVFITAASLKRWCGNSREELETASRLSPPRTLAVDGERRVRGRGSLSHAREACRCRLDRSPLTSGRARPRGRGRRAGSPRR